jgi:hypothetical protein
MYCICVLGILVLFIIGEVMYCICVLGDIIFIYYWRSHVLCMCEGISVLFTIGEVMYFTCVLGINKTNIPNTHIQYMTSPIVNKTDIP